MCKAKFNYFDVIHYIRAFSLEGINLDTAKITIFQWINKKK